MKQKRLKEIVAHIKAHPANWRQGVWHCGTSHCVGGFCELKAAGYSLGSAFDHNQFAKLFNVRERLGKKGASLWKTLMGKFYKKTELNYAGGDITQEVAKKYLGLSSAEADYLFAGDRTLDELSKVANTARFPPHIGK